MKWVLSFINLSNNYDEYLNTTQAKTKNIPNFQDCVIT